MEMLIKQIKADRHNYEQTKDEKYRTRLKREIYDQIVLLGKKLGHSDRDAYMKGKEYVEQS